MVYLDADWPTIAAAPPSNPECHVIPDNLAYLLYTSGSTGQPKGVQIEHRGLLNLVLWHQRAFAISAADRAAQIAGMGFDASVWEIWPYLATGASLHFPAHETRLSPPLLRDWLVERAITITFVPTPLAEHVLALEWPRRLALRLLLTGGDTLHGYPAADLPFSLVNNYGPTESTVVATSGQISAPLSGETTPSIGRPIQHTQVYILDRHLNLMPAGMPGELYIGGAGIARGYHNRPDLTAAAFIPNPFVRDKETRRQGDKETEDDAAVTQNSKLKTQNLRLYRTGDLARYLPDGSIAFLGRIDQQVKIRGFRIELGEIEAALELHPAVRECVVETREEASGEKRLVAYVVPTNDQRPTTNDQRASTSDSSSVLSPQSSVLRTFLAEHLPDYMIPSVFVPLDALPLTSNGKVNRQALPAPREARPALDQTYVPPQTEFEQMIARIWRRVLPVEQVGVHDNFFDLGGHSLSMVEAHSQLQETFGDKLTLLDLFQYPTIHTLANRLAQDVAPLNPALQTSRDVARARREALQQRAYVQDRRRTQRREGGRGE